jgi:hypothetical protein
MNFNEKILYHQIHPAKLTADISGGLVSTYLLWNHQFALAMLVAFVPAILASAILLRFADLQHLKDSRFGKYIHRFMDRRIEAWRFAGLILMWFGAWHHRWWAIVVGTLAIIAAWMVGLWFKPPNDLPRSDRSSMRYRKLRIAFSVFCGLACVLLIVPWLRSYWWNDSVKINQSSTNYFGFLTMSADTIIASDRGRVGGIWNGASGLFTPSTWQISSGPPSIEDDNDPDPGILGFCFTNAPLGMGRIFSVPYWFLVVTLAAIGGAPWLPWWPKRFSLRTLLIATTLVAVGLGAVVWSIR